MCAYIFSELNRTKSCVHRQIWVMCFINKANAVRCWIFRQPVRVFMLGLMFVYPPPLRLAWSCSLLCYISIGATPLSPRFRNFIHLLSHKTLDQSKREWGIHVQTAEHCTVNRTLNNGIYFNVKKNHSNDMRKTPFFHFGLFVEKLLQYLNRIT